MNASISQATFDGRAFIDGRRVAMPQGSNPTFDCISPRDGRLIAEVARCGENEVDAAVKAARRAFEDGRWAYLSPRKRKQVLLRFSELLRQHGDELALMETLDMGKPISCSKKADLPNAAHCFQWYAEAIDKVYDEIAPTSPTYLALVQREAIGVVAAIVPWNYPMMMAAWKLAPALACGNSVILKPSEKSPLTALRMAEIAREAGIPDGVFNVLPGLGGEAGRLLALHPDVDCIGFTGSTKVGKLMFQYAGQSNLKRVWTELGGKSPLLVFADADAERAINTCLGGIFYNQGESCNAPSRLLVHRSHYEYALELAQAAAAQHAPSDPLGDDCVMGAIVDEQQLNTIARYIESGKKEGASLTAGGSTLKLVVDGSDRGFYVSPTVFAGVKPEMTIAREEIFGPVLSVIPFDDSAEAIAIANKTSYGLAASVWSRNIDLAHRAARALRAGTVHVNSYDEDDITAPFGGFKESGNGRDKSLHALDKYSEIKTTWIRFDNPLER